MPKKSPSLAHTFVERLANTYSTPSIPQEQLAEYIHSLIGWNLKPEQWDKVLETIKATEYKLPSIARILEVIREVKLLSGNIIRNRAVQLFELDGYQKARYFTMPDIPPLPPGATNARIRIIDSVPNPNEEIPSTQEAREIFRREFVKAGGKPGLADKWFAEIDKKSKPPDPYNDL